MNTLQKWDGYEEWAAQSELVWQYLRGRAEGFFVEVGANAPQFGSQTWLLEQRGWRGVLVEPQAKLCEQLRAQRPRSQVFHVACTAPHKTGTGILHIPQGGLDGFATLERNVDDLNIVYDQTESVRLVTLDAILSEAGISRVDFISIDTEGTELDVLRGFDLHRHRPALVLIEDKLNSLDKHSYLSANGYRLVKRTELNNWYVPAGEHFTMTSVGERLRLWRKVFLGLPIRRWRQWRRQCRRPILKR